MLIHLALLVAILRLLCAIGAPACPNMRCKTLSSSQHRLRQPQDASATTSQHTKQKEILKETIARNNFASQPTHVPKSLRSGRRTNAATSMLEARGNLGTIMTHLDAIVTLLGRNLPRTFLQLRPSCAFLPKLARNVHQIAPYFLNSVPFALKPIPSCNLRQFSTPQISIFVGAW